MYFDQSGFDPTIFLLSIGFCFLLGAVVQRDGSENQDNDVLPRPKRRRMRRKLDRGLPSDKELAALANAYLVEQRKLWPELVTAGLLPEIADEAIYQMVVDFKRRHRGGDVSYAELSAFARLVDNLGGNYNRFSSERSQSTSVIDQMTKCLRLGREKDTFIPWSFVYCDYAVSGLTTCRHGYNGYKKLLRDKNCPITTTFIDDFTRASRESIEWWKLAYQAKRAGKKMFGASDSFNLDDPNWEVWITIYSLLSKLFIKGLRQKVVRGMAGGRRRGKNVLGRLPIGFTRKVKRDENGHVVRDSEGRPKHVICIDKPSRKIVRLIFRLFVAKKWSTHRIAKYLNLHKFDGSNSWTHTTVRRILRNPASIGVFIWNMWSRVPDFDEETGEETYVRVKNPRKEWEVCFDPSLRIVPMKFYQTARRRLAESRRGRRWSKSRNERSASTLFSGTLFCECCLNHDDLYRSDAELKLVRSAGKNKQMACLRGISRTYGCDLTSSKSVRIIENCLLGFILDALVTEERLTDFVDKVNEHLVKGNRSQVGVVIYGLGAEGN